MYATSDFSGMYLKPNCKYTLFHPHNKLSFIQNQVRFVSRTKDKNVYSVLPIFYYGIFIFAYLLLRYFLK